MKSNETTHAANPLDDITAALEKALHQASQQAEQTINDARKQADTIINDARKQADTIINDARTQADTIIADAQADARAKGDMERASLAIQEHAAALHTLALGLTGHENAHGGDNTGNASGSAGNDSSGSSNADTSTNTDTDETVNADDISASANNANTHSADVIPPAPTATDPDNATTNAIRANAPTTRRANGTTRKLAPWEQPQEPKGETTPEPEETPTIDTTEGNNPEHTSTAQDATTPPTWDAPLVIDAPLQL